jgi:hypothetical protein
MFNSVQFNKTSDRHFEQIRKAVSGDKFKPGDRLSPVKAQTLRGNPEEGRWFGKEYREEQ